MATQYTIDPTLVDVTAVKVRSFAQSLDAKLMVVGGKLDRIATTVPINGTSTTVDQHGGIELKEIAGLYPRIEESQIELTRRLLEWKRYAKAIYVDKAQITEIIEDPTGKYAMQLANAYKRLKDKIILAAAIGSVKTGVNGDTVVSASTDGVLTIDATSGLTYEKVLELTRNFIDNSVYDDMSGNPILTLTGDENLALMKEAEYLSSGNSLGDNFNSMIGVESHRVKRIGDFDAIMFGANDINGTVKLIPEDASYRYNVALAPGSITLGIGMNPTLEIVSLPDHYNTVAIKYSCGIGAVRNQGQLVQILKTTK